MNPFTAAALSTSIRSPRLPRGWLVLIAAPLMLWVLGHVAGCAATGAGAGASTAEPITAFDEPEMTRKRRIAACLVEHHHPPGASCQRDQGLRSQFARILAAGEDRHYARWGTPEQAAQTRGLILATVEHLRLPRHGTPASRPPRF